MSKRSTNIMVALIFILAVVPSLISIYKSFVPVTSWLEVSKFEIIDAKFGHDPKVIVERIIHKPFSGEWLVEINNAKTDELITKCKGAGSGIYSSENKLPEVIELFKWWMDLEYCILPVGEYYVETQWTIKDDDYPPKILQIRSNNFKVLE